MSIVRWLFWVLPTLLAACHADVAPPADCGIAPPGFLAWHDYSLMAMPIVPPAVNTIGVDRTGAIRWNDVPLGGLEDRRAIDVVDQYLAAAAELEPRPLVTVVFGRGSRCADLAAIRQAIEKHYHCRRETGCLQGSSPY